MSIIIISVLIGLGLSVSWGLSSWLNWQWMKNGTIIPTGSFTSKYGHKASFVLKGLSVFVLLNVLISFKWWVVLTTGIMLFVGGWIATLIERKLYSDDLRKETFVFAAEEYVKDMGSEDAAQLMSKVVPQWWIKLMPEGWQKEYREMLVPILLPTDKLK